MSFLKDDGKQFHTVGAATSKLLSPKPLSVTPRGGQCPGITEGQRQNHNWTTGC